MSSYLQRLESTPSAEQWPLARRWLFEQPLPFFAELRRHRPVLVLPEVTLVARFADCAEVLQRHEQFSVKLYAPKQGDYWMAQDDTARHWREKSVMRAVLDREDIPAIRSWVGEEAARRLRQATWPFDAVSTLTRAVPLALVQHWFGFADSDPATLERWSYWNQMDAFWNQPFDQPGFSDPSTIVQEREAANAAMRGYLVTLVQRRAAELAAGNGGNDVVTRLLRLSGSGALRLDAASVILNVGGLLIGAVETTSHAVVNALDELLARPDVLAAARAAAHTDDPAAVDGFVFEALRFRPAFPYFFRVAEHAVTLARGTDHATRIPAGTTVLALTHSAMFDQAAFDAPETFDQARPCEQGFTFGLGLHECLGRPIAAVMIPEIVRQALRVDDLDTGPVDRRGGPMPESWEWQRTGAAPCGA